MMLLSTRLPPEGGGCLRLSPPEARIHPASKLDRMLVWKPLHTKLQWESHASTLNGQLDPSDTWPRR